MRTKTSVPMPSKTTKPVSLSAAVARTFGNLTTAIVIMANGIDRITPRRLRIKPPVAATIATSHTQRSIYRAPATSLIKVNTNATIVLPPFLWYLPNIYSHIK